MKTKTFSAMILSALTALCALALTGCGSNRKAEPLSEITYKNETDFTCVFDGITHEVLVELPSETKDAPLVLMLHGYGNDAESFRLTTHFDDDAVPRGYVVAYVTGAADPGDATSSIGWNSGIGDSPNRDVEFLTAVTAYLQDTYGCDRKKTYAVGFSNGAFMTHRLAVEAPDVFRAVVSVAGMMPEQIWEAREDKPTAGIFQVTGEKDNVVPKNADGSAKYAKAPAIEDVIAYYVSANNLCATEESPLGKKGRLIRYFDPDSDTQVWDLTIKDGRHSWPEEAYTGFSINDLILDYLDSMK